VYTLEATYYTVDSRSNNLDSDNDEDGTDQRNDGKGKVSTAVAVVALAYYYCYCSRRSVRTAPTPASARRNSPPVREEPLLCAMAVVAVPSVRASKASCVTAQRFATRSVALSASTRTVLPSRACVKVGPALLLYTLCWK
jgi:hypothetical protein